jgi:hypothetical protein
LYRELIGNNAPFKVEIEVAPNGISITQLNTQVIYAWSEIEELFETPDSVDFVARGGGLVVVKKRAFASLEETSKFVEEATRYLDQFRESFTAANPDSHT